MALVACQRKQAYDFCVDIRWVDVFSVRFLFSLYELDVFFGGDWRRELVVRGMHVRTVCRFHFYAKYVVRFVPRSWYGTVACDGRLLYPSKTSTHVTRRYSKLDR